MSKRTGASCGLGLRPMSTLEDVKCGLCNCKLCIGCIHLAPQLLQNICVGIMLVLSCTT